MRAFFSSQQIKDHYVARAYVHRQADEIAQGAYYDDSGPKLRCCAVGCVVHSSDHSAYERDLGIPRSIAILEDDIFEHLPLEVAKNFPVRFLEAIPVGADLSQVTAQFLWWLLDRDGYDVGQYATERERGAIDAVAALYRRSLAGEQVTPEEWVSAKAAAAPFSSYATYAATFAASVYIDASYAASAATAAAAAADEKHEAAERMADTLIALLAAAPVDPHLAAIQESIETRSLTQARY